MRAIETFYPCESCGEEIPPLDNYCRFCGKKQRNIAKRLQYTVFFQVNNGSNFRRPLGGSPILTLADAQGIIREIEMGPYKYFVGTFYKADWVVDADEDGAICKVTNWYPVVKRKFKKDQGPRTIKVTFLQ